MIKKVAKGSFKIALTLVLLIAIYGVIALVFSIIRLSAETPKGNDGVVYIITNGVHTDIVLPVKNNQMDWSKQVKFKNTVNNDSSLQYLALGWGDKGFYLETPTWDDLKFSTAFKAAFGLSTTAMHATFYKRMEENKNCVKLTLSKAQYQRLINYISNSFKKDEKGNFKYIKTNANYGINDAFYEAKGSYSLFQTCNTWTNNGLKCCGQKACLWTPFDKGIFYHYN
jgi:uncharacterized protein (TIGR02117 family)